MRITTETLLRIADDYIQRRLRDERGIIAVYLHGSLLGPSPVLGGTADIDLFFIHLDTRLPEREIERLTDDVHLDVAHHTREDYRRTRDLRLHPWLGPVLNSCKILYDPQHFLDFTQAGVRAQFDRPDNVLARARQQASQSRQAWLGYQIQPPVPGPEGLKDYLRAVQSAANAIALLNGPPLTERRFLLQFHQRAEAVQHPGLLAGLLGLLGGSQVTPGLLGDLLTAWQAAYKSLPIDSVPQRLHPHRLPYYLRAMEHLLASEATSHLVLWTMVNTWTDIALLHPGVVEQWQSAMTQLGLVDSGLESRLQALDAYLDTVDETLDAWAQEQGA